MGLARAAQLDNTLRNDERKPVRFFAVPSVPCFELWLLLHFVEVQSYFHRDEIYQKLKQHVPKYDKGMDGTYEATVEHLPTATVRASKLRGRFSPHAGDEPYTDMDLLVQKLKGIVRS